MSAATKEFVHVPGPSSTGFRSIALASFVTVLGGAAIVLGLDAAQGFSMDRQTISAYVFSAPVAWTSAITLIVIGSAALHASLVGHRWLKPFSAPSILLGLWTVGIALVGIFPKHDWSVGPSLSGHIHRVGSLVAFIVLPLAVCWIVLAARRFTPFGWVAFALAMGGALTIAYLGWTVVTAEPLPWWQAIDLGIAERVLCAFEVAALLALAADAIRARSRQA